MLGGFLAGLARNPTRSQFITAFQPGRLPVAEHQAFLLFFCCEKHIHFVLWRSIVSRSLLPRLRDAGRANAEDPWLRSWTQWRAVLDSPAGCIASSHLVLDFERSRSVSTTSSPIAVFACPRRLRKHISCSQDTPVLLCRFSPPGSLSFRARRAFVPRCSALAALLLTTEHPRPWASTLPRTER